MTRPRNRAVTTLVERALDEQPEQVARAMERQSVEDATRLVADYPGPHWIRVFKALSSERAADILRSLSADDSGRLLATLEPPLAAAILSRLDDADRQAALDRAEPAVVSELNQLLSFPPNSAGSLMDPRVMTFLPTATAGEVLERLRASTWKRIFNIYVVNERGVLEGSVPLQEIAISSPTTPLSQIQRPPAAVVQSIASREELVDLFETKKTPALPVMDFEGRMLGIVRYDALISAAQEEASVDIQTMVGASKEERALSKVSFAVKKRLPWLEVNLGTAFLAASVVGMFESLIAQFTALAVLLPVVAGQSGNTGAQALAVTMRGLALREIRVRQWARVLFKEFRVGLLNGVAVALTTSFFVFIWSRSVGLAAVIGTSMVLSMALAGLSGGAIPILLTAIGQDPAQSSSIILTTVTDVVGFFSFLGIATLLAGII